MLSGIHDHEIISTNTYITARPLQRKILLWSNANLESIKLTALSLALDFMNCYDTNTAVDTLWERFKLICNA